MNEHAASAPHRPIAFAPARAQRVTDPDGTIRITCPAPLGAYDPSLARLFRAAVEKEPARIFVQERHPDGWRKLTYEQARGTVDALAAALLARGLSAQRPVMILSGNAIEHALLMLAGYTAGVPVAPISVAYSLQSQDFAKLKHIAELLEPGLVYVGDTAPFAKALGAIGSRASFISTPRAANRSSISLRARGSTSIVTPNAFATQSAVMSSCVGPMPPVVKT